MPPKKIKLECEPFGFVGINICEDREHEEKVLSKQLQELRQAWPSIWPKIYNSILTERADYDKKAIISKENLKELVVSPPGDYIDYELDNWNFTLTLSPFDGSFVVEFELNGEIVDTEAIF